MAKKENRRKIVKYSRRSKTKETKMRVQKVSSINRRRRRRGKERGGKSRPLKRDWNRKLPDLTSFPAR